MAVIEDANTRAPRFSLRAVAILVGVLVALPMITGVVVFTGRSWLPIGDLAIIDLRVRDVFSVHVPLVGPYSRFGWSHPGPLMYWLIAPVATISGGATWGTRVGAVLLQLAPMCWLLVMLWRRGGLAYQLLGSATLAGTFLATGSFLVSEPWNPHIALPFFVLFLFQLWLLRLGDARQIVALVVVGSLLVQTHVGYLPLVVLGLTWGLGGLVYEARRRDESIPGLRRTAKLSVAAGVVLWAAPLYELIINWPGNLAHVGRFFVGGAGEAPLGLSEGLRLLAAEFRFVPPWLGGADDYSPLNFGSVGASAWWLVIPALLLGSGFLCARRSKRRDQQQLILLAALITVGGVFVIARVTGTPYQHLYYWRIAVAVLVVASAVWALWTAFAASRLPVLAAIALVFVAWGSIDLAIAVGQDKSTPLQHFRPVAESLLRQLRSENLPRGQVQIRHGGPIPTGPALLAALTNALERDGKGVWVEPSRDFEFGAQRDRPAGRVDAIWYTAEQGYVLSELLARPDARLLATTSPLDARSEDRLQEIQLQLEAELLAAGRLDLVSFLDSPRGAVVVGQQPGIDTAAAAELARLTRRVSRAAVCRCGIVEFPINRR